ncbi:MAG: hypothetical protein ACYC1Q_11545, partial [Bacteroidia bacterium]
MSKDEANGINSLGFHFMRTSLFLAGFLISISAYSQPLDFGIGLSLGYSVPEKLETNVNSPFGKLGPGLTSSLRCQLNPAYSIYSGLNIIRKPSFIQHDEYDFPGLTHTGRFRIGMTNTLIQIPILVSRTFYRTSHRPIRRSVLFEIFAGVNACMLKPTALVVSTDWTPHYQENDTLRYAFTAGNNDPDFKAKYGFELNCGLVYNFKTNADSKKYHSIMLGVERTFFNGPAINYK